MKGVFAVRIKRFYKHVKKNLHRYFLKKFTELSFPLLKLHNTQSKAFVNFLDNTRSRLTKPLWAIHLVRTQVFEKN